MASNNGEMGIKAAWKKDDWMAVWIGFIILAVFLAGITFKPPSFKWMSNSEFRGKANAMVSTVETIAMDARTSGEGTLASQAKKLVSAIEAGERDTVSKAAGSLQNTAKEVGDKDLAGRASKIASDIKKTADTSIANLLAGGNLRNLLLLFIGFFILSSAGMRFMGIQIGNFVKSFPIVFILAALASFIGGNAAVSGIGLEVVFWALIIGLFISNVFGVPDWLKHAVKTEFFIKIGIVMLGAEVLFRTVMSVGAYGLVQAVVVIIAVFYVCFWVSKKLGLDDEFASILGTGVSICGVSAAIATGGAIKGDPKKVSHTISLVLLCAIPMLVFEPLIVKAVGMVPTVAGAWIGGTIDTTGAVVAAGSIAGDKAMNVAVVIKMAQNAFIGLAAFLLAIWFTFKKNATGEKPGGKEIWVRFPKFVIGFVIASLVMSLLIPGNYANSVIGITKSIRGWWFTLAFLCIGLDTRFKELFAMGRGKPATAFLIAQAFNIGWTLLIAYLIFGGVLFPAPKF
jgi:uncharacterized integral membrane protein (TIGR00698 family)